MITGNFNIAKTPQVTYFVYLSKWLFLSLFIGIIIGSVSAFFLSILDWVTHWRDAHIWIVAFLPLGGLMIGFTYHYLGASIVKGNNQLLEEFHRPRNIIPLRMAPLVLVGTVATHFFGGSAGREGTAVQMGGAIADQFTKWLKLKGRDRKVILTMGISAGFAAVFGTPLAGAVFAMEVMVVGRIRYEAILPCFLVATIADYTCEAWGGTHTSYVITYVPPLDASNLFWTLLAGIAFGLAALLFTKASHFFSGIFSKGISYAPLRPFYGGIVIALAVLIFGGTNFIGLGIPTIERAFSYEMPSYYFLLKLLFTAFTLAAGFKGGEVTPLFFIGATLGNALFLFFPLPLALLAGMGFVAVFSGATNTPLDCTLMGLELFGAECGVYIGLVCVVAYLFSGHTGIYSSQIIGSPKHIRYGRMKGKNINDTKNKILKNNTNA